MKIALVAQHATPLRPRTGAGPDSDDIGLSELTRRLAVHGHQVTVFTQKHQPDLPDQAELHAGVRITHINAGSAPADGDRGDASLLERVPAFSGPLRSMLKTPPSAAQAGSRRAAEYVRSATRGAGLHRSRSVRSWTRLRRPKGWPGSPAA